MAKMDPAGLEQSGVDVTLVRRMTEECTEPDGREEERELHKTAKLVNLRGIGQRQFVLPDRESVMGSAVDSDMWIDHPTVSRHHFAIKRDGLAYLIRDLGSTNGTFVNGVRIREVYLKPGSKIQAGKIDFCFEIDS